MKIYSVLMFIIAFMFLIFSSLLIIGETKWLNSFNKGKYKNPKEYSKFLGKYIFYFSIAFLLSGILGLFLSNVISFNVLIMEIIILILTLCKNAKKFYK